MNDSSMKEKVREKVRGKVRGKENKPVGKPEWVFGVKHHQKHL
jgi:hypothetical protein